MIRIAPSDTWAGLKESKSGDGAVVITGKVLNLSSGYLAGVAQLSKRIDVRPGEVINVRVLARKISGDDGREGRIGISYPTDASPKNQIKIESESWQKYSIRFAVPHTHDNATDAVNLIFATNNEDEGEFEYTELEVTSEQCGLPSPSLIAMGFVTMTNGVPSLRDDFKRHGIVSLDYTGVLLTIQTDYTYRINSEFIPIVTATHDGQTNRNVQVGATMDSSGLGRIYIVFSNPSTGVAIDMTTIDNLSFNFAVLG